MWDGIISKLKPRLSHGTEWNSGKHGTAMYVLTAVSDLHKLYITG